jgi:hypothetical protein
LTFCEVPQLYKKWPSSDYYFLADDDAFVNWPGTLRAMKAFQPDEPVIVGFSGGNGSPCGPKKGGEFFFYGGLFAFTRSAAALFTQTITDATSKFAFFRLHGCRHSHDFGHALPHFWKCPPSVHKKVNKLWPTCSGLLKQMDKEPLPPKHALEQMTSSGCKPEHAVRDFGAGRYIYSFFKDDNDNDDVIISFWAMEFAAKLRRVSWPCLAEGMLPGRPHLFAHQGLQDWDPIGTKRLARDLLRGGEIIAIHHAKPWYQQKVYCMLQHQHLQPPQAAGGGC